MLGGDARNRIATVDAGTGVLQPWNPNANDAVNAIAVGGGMVFIGGAFTSPRNKIASLDPSTGLPLSWNAAANGNVSALALSGTTLYVGGAFTSMGGQSRSNVAALDPSTAAATNWNPGPNGAVSTLALSIDTVHLGGAFTAVGFEPQSYVAAVSVQVNAAPPIPDGAGLTLLQQIRPNPFRASTVIRFSLASWQQVSLKIYDVQGREVASLIDNLRQSPGVHTVGFQRGRLASGVYVAFLKAGKAVDTRRIICIR